MIRTMLATLVALSTASAAWAQDHALTPTDVLEFGQVSGTVRLSLAEGRGDLANDPAVDMDVDLNQFRAILDAAVGLGMGFEVELSIPYEFKQTLEADGTIGVPNVKFEEEDSGFGDLTVQGVYRLVKETKGTPQWVLALILTAPTGNDKQGEADVTAPPPIGNTEGVEGGIGEGVWRYGFGSAVSMNLGGVEPYLGLSYVFGGERTRNGVDEERADVGSILVGAEFHVSPTATIDLRGTVTFKGDDITEDNRLEKEEEAHVILGAQGALYAGIAPGVTLVLGGGVLRPEDHEIDTTANLEFEGVFIYYLQIGLHIKLGL